MVGGNTYFLRGPVLPPNHERVVRALSEAELEDEIQAGRGEPDYQLALVREHERRARLGAPKGEE